jgi:hypothetical protein
VAATSLPDAGDDSDTAVKAFWTAFMAKWCTGTAPNKTCAPFKYFELWNEPNASGFWNGNYRQLAKMSSDATAIIKSECTSCVVLTSNVSCGGDGSHDLPDPNLDGGHDSGICTEYMSQYLSAWQSFGNLPDAAAWHPYPSRTTVSPPPFPETNVSNGSAACTDANVPNPSCRFSILDQVREMRAVFDAHGLKGKPMYGTEGSWLSNERLPNVEQEQAWLARWYLVLASSGLVNAAFWYSQDLLTAAPLYNPDAASLKSAGHAYDALHSWLEGASIGACEVRGSVWVCPVAHGSAVSEIVWDASTAALNGATQPFGTGTHTKVTTLDGTTQTITGASVTIGMSPVWIQ